MLLNPPRGHALKMDVSTHLCPPSAALAFINILILWLVWKWNPALRYFDLYSLITQEVDPLFLTFLIFSLSSIIHLIYRLLRCLFPISLQSSLQFPTLHKSTCRRLQFKHQKQNVTKWLRWRVRVKTGPRRILGMKCAKQPPSWGLKSFFHLEPGVYKTVTTLWAFPEKVLRCLATQ